jgi:hypothetical protein
MDTFVPELNHFRSKFNVHNRVKLEDFNVRDLLDCSNTADICEELPNFEPGTMYVLYGVSESAFEELGQIIQVDDMSVAKLFRESPDDTTVYLCFKGLDEPLLKKASDMIRIFVKDNVDASSGSHYFEELDIRKVACALIKECLYF